MSTATQTINDGGPAFPGESDHQSGPSTFYSCGMTLREYFAGRAMQGLLAGSMGGKCWVYEYAWNHNAGAEPLARLAVQAADALIAELSK